MLEAVKSEYERRGSPIAFTGWTVHEVKAFMLDHLKKVKKGGDCGVHARLLPRRPSPELPAPLPDGISVQDDDDKDSSGSSEKEGFSESEDDGLTDEGWKIQKKKGKYMLVHTETKESIELGHPDKGSTWEVYQDDDVDYLNQTDNDDWEAMSCLEYFQEVKASEKALDKKKAKPAPKTPMSERRAPRMKGMAEKTRAAPSEKKHTQQPAQSQEEASPPPEEEEEFGASSDESPQAPEEDENEEDMWMPFIAKDRAGKMFLIDPKPGKELKLPVDKCSDWEIVKNPEKKGYELVSKSNKDTPKDVEVIMAGRKAKKVEDEARFKLVQDVHAKVEKYKDEKVQKAALKNLEKVAEEHQRAREEDREKQRQKTEAHQKAAQERERKMIEDAVKLKEDKEAKAQEEAIRRMKAEIEEEERKKLEERKKKKEQEEKEALERIVKEKEQEKIDAEKKKQLEEKLRREIQAKLEKEEAGKSDKASKIPDKAGDEEGDVHKTKETEKSKPEETDTVPEKGESKPKDKSKPKEEEPKKPAKSSGTDKKSDTQESFERCGGDVAGWINAQVKQERQLAHTKFWDRVRAREKREAKAKRKESKSVSTQEQPAGLQSKLPQINLDWVA